MQFSFLAFSATALLTRVASCFSFLTSTHGDLSDYGFARIDFGSAYAGCGFYGGTTRPYVSTTLDAEGDIGSDFVLRPNGDGTWILFSRAAASIKVIAFFFPPAIIPFYFIPTRGNLFKPTHRWWYM